MKIKNKKRESDNTEPPIEIQNAHDYYMAKKDTCICCGKDMTEFQQDCSLVEQIFQTVAENELMIGGEAEKLPSSFGESFLTDGMLKVMLHFHKKGSMDIELFWRDLGAIIGKK